MRYVLATLGYLWAGVGLLNIGYSPAWDQAISGDGLPMAGVLVFNAVLFVFPGLLIGVLVWPKDRPNRPQAE